MTTRTKREEAEMLTRLARVFTLLGPCFVNRAWAALCSVFKGSREELEDTLRLIFANHGGLEEPTRICGPSPAPLDQLCKLAGNPFEGLDGLLSPILNPNFDMATEVKKLVQLIRLWCVTNFSDQRGMTPFTYCQLALAACRIDTLLPLTCCNVRRTEPTDPCYRVHAALVTGSMYAAMGDMPANCYAGSIAICQTIMVRIDKHAQSY
jgi:hypothetical protein